jgi:hypothetical protein
MKRNNDRFQSIVLFFCLLVATPLCSYTQVSNETETTILTDSAFWNIFQGFPNPNDSLHEGHLDFIFHLIEIKRNFWTGKIKFTAYPVILTKKSWIKHNCRNDRNMNYLMTVYELADLYSLKLADYFSMNSLAFPSQESFEEDVEEQSEQYKELYVKQLENLDKDSNYGRDEIKVEKWFISIQEKKYPYLKK